MTAHQVAVALRESGFGRIDETDCHVFGVHQDLDAWCRCERQDSGAWWVVAHGPAPLGNVDAPGMRNPRALIEILTSVYGLTRRLIKGVH